MDNSFFIFTDKTQNVEIERFHICTWEFNNDSSLVEFGFEILSESITTDSLSLSLFIPWFKSSCETKDLYSRLIIPENSRFIFNDALQGSNYLDGGQNKSGIIQKFSDRNEIGILPVTFDKNIDKVITISVNLKPYIDYSTENKPNIYFRFSIKPEIPFISMRKKGINKSTIIYDIKVNEKRNIPEEKVNYFSDKTLCKVRNCFLFNVIPNKYDIVFFDNSSLKNVRTLEFESFNRYLEDSRVKEDELIVVFNKKQNTESFSFFSIYAKERIGVGQFSLALLLNVFCGLLFFIASYRNPPATQVIPIRDIIFSLPTEIYFATALMLVSLLYFIWPLIAKNLSKRG